jgi:hypothetical protein
MVLGGIDDRLMECGVGRRSFLKLCSALPVGLKKYPTRKSLFSDSKEITKSAVFAKPLAL